MYAGKPDGILMPGRRIVAPGVKVRCIYPPEYPGASLIEDGIYTIERVVRENSDVPYEEPRILYLLKELHPSGYYADRFELCEEEELE